MDAATPTCTEHAGQPVTAPCPRCGRFVCKRCRPVEGVCGACAVWRARELPSAALRALTLRRWLLASVGTAAVSTALVWGELFGVWSLRADDGDALPLLPLVLLLWVLAVLVTAVGTPVAFLRWFHAAIRQVETVSGTVGMSAGLAVAWWFTPWGNFFRPYHVMRHLYRRVTGDRELEPRLIQWWWGAWVLQELPLLACLRLLVAAAHEDTGLRPQDLAATASSVLTLPAALLCLWVVRRIDAGLKRRLEVGEVGALDPEAVRGGLLAA